MQPSPSSGAHSVSGENVCRDVGCAGEISVITGTSHNEAYVGYGLCAYLPRRREPLDVLDPLGRGGGAARWS